MKSILRAIPCILAATLCLALTAGGVRANADKRSLDDYREFMRYAYEYLEEAKALERRAVRATGNRARVLNALARLNRQMAKQKKAIAETFLSGNEHKRNQAEVRYQDLHHRADVIRKSGRVSRPPPGLAKAPPPRNPVRAKAPPRNVLVPPLPPRDRVATPALVRQRHERLAALTTGLVRRDMIVEVGIEGAPLRDLPDRKSPIVRHLGRGDLIHVVASLPSGWGQVAERGRPIGWVHRRAIHLPPKTASTAASKVSADKVPALARTAEPQGQSLSYPFPTGPANPDAVAIIVGNRHYRHGDVPEVRFAHNDVAAIRRYVHKTLGFAERNIVLLRDATKADLMAHFGSPEEHQGRLYDLVRAGRSDVLVYYSGHGVPGRGGAGYLLPSDGDPGKARLTGYGIDTLIANLGKARARSVTVMLDTCFSGLSHGGALLPAASGIYLAARLPGGLQNGAILTAADGSQIASWDTDAGLGLFTRYLLEGLLGQADRADRGGDDDGRVSLGEIRTYLQGEVAYQARRRFGRDQTPQAHGDPSRLLSSVLDADFPGFGADGFGLSKR